MNRLHLLSAFSNLNAVKRSPYYLTSQFSRYLTVLGHQSPETSYKAEPYNSLNPINCNNISRVVIKTPYENKITPIFCIYSRNFRSSSILATSKQYETQTTRSNIKRLSHETSQEPPMITCSKEQNKSSSSNNQEKTKWRSFMNSTFNRFLEKCRETTQLTRSFFESHLLLSNCLVATSLFSIADVLCQKIEGSGDNLEPTNESTVDWMRTLRFGIFALFFNGPLYTFWYGKFLKTYVASKPATFYYKAVVPTFLDTFVLGPIFLVFFIYMISLMSGDTTSTSIKKLKSDFPFALLVDVVVWPPIQLVNFTFIPPSFQGLFVCVTDLFWAIFLSWISSNKRHRENID